MLKAPVCDTEFLAAEVEDDELLRTVKWIEMMETRPDLQDMLDWSDDMQTTSWSDIPDVQLESKS